MFNVFKSTWLRLTRAVVLRRRSMLQARLQELATARALLMQVEQATTLRQLAAVQTLVLALSWARAPLRRDLTRAVSSKLARLPSPACPRSSSSRRRRAKSTTKRRR